jgi:hypothetical protein
VVCKAIERDDGAPAALMAVLSMLVEGAITVEGMHRGLCAMHHAGMHALVGMGTGDQRERTLN